MEELVEILSKFLGEPKNTYSSDVYQYQFNCIQCADDEGVESDGKYNLEVNLIKSGGKFKCWKCSETNNMHGSISKLIKSYAGENTLREYREAINIIKKSKEYEFNFANNEFSLEEDEEFKIELPEKTYEFNFDGNKKEKHALDYLKARGITENIIKKHRLMYTDYYCANKNFRNRIIIPSYDKYNELNYYTGRDYSGKNFRKYFNFENSNKKQIIFNENLINWDGDITLVEGPVDHLVIPNSITLLGKSIGSDYYLFEMLMKRSTQRIIVFLDDDATFDSEKICKMLSSFELCNRIYMVPTKKLLEKLNKSKNIDLKKLDPGKLFELFGRKGISWAIKNAEKYDCI